MSQAFILIVLRGNTPRCFPEIDDAASDFVLQVPKLEVLARIPVP